MSFLYQRVRISLSYSNPYSICLLSIKRVRGYIMENPNGDSI